jgi:hypothetical protein
MSHLLQHPGKEKLEKFSGLLDDQIDVFKNGLANNRLPDRVLIAMRDPSAVLCGSEEFASMSIDGGTKHFILTALSKRHREDGFRYWYEVSVAPDGAIEAQVFRAPDDRVKTPQVPPKPGDDCWF